MKTILIPTEPHDSMPSVLETALLMGRKFNSHIEGFALRPAIGNIVTMDPVNSLTPGLRPVSPFAGPGADALGVPSVADATSPGATTAPFTMVETISGSKRELTAVPHQ